MNRNITKFLLCFIYSVCTSCAQEVGYVYDIEVKIQFRSLSDDTITEFYSNEANDFIISVDEEDNPSMIKDYKRELYILIDGTEYDVSPLWALDNKESAESYERTVVPMDSTSFIAGYLAQGYTFDYKRYGEQRNIVFWISENPGFADIFYPYVLKDNNLIGSIIKIQTKHGGFELKGTQEVNEQFQVPMEIIKTHFFKTKTDLLEYFEKYATTKTSDAEVNRYLLDHSRFYRLFLQKWIAASPGTAENLMLGTAQDALLAKMPIGRIRDLPSKELEEVKDYFLKTEKLVKNLDYIVRHR